MLFSWMKSLILYLILAGLALHMSPTSQYKQYIRYFIGLVVIVLLASPIRYLFRLGSGDVDELIAEMEEAASGYAEETDSFGSIYDYYDMSLRESMKQELAKFGVSDLSLITDSSGNILKCTVWVKSDAQNPEEEIKKFISDVYNVEQSRIYVIRR